MKFKSVAVASVMLVGGGSTVITGEPFDPWAYNPATLDELYALPISDQDKWEWLLQRRAEINVCFEDEFLNDDGECEVEE